MWNIFITDLSHNSFYIFYPCSCHDQTNNKCVLSCQKVQQAQTQLIDMITFVAFSVCWGKRGGGPFWLKTIFRREAYLYTPPLPHFIRSLPNPLNHSFTQVSICRFFNNRLQNKKKRQKNIWIYKGKTRLKYKQKKIENNDEK